MLDFLGTVGSAIMTPLYYVTTVILVGFHTAFAAVLGPDSDWAWALSIVGLTVVIRVLLIPLFVKQIKTSRNMQVLQPKVKDLQKKYGHDRERLAQETMKLYQETGTNPFSSCLPLLLQAPIFFALFRTLNGVANDEPPKGIMTESQGDALANATIFGAKISDTFMAADSLHVQVLTIVLVIVMTVTTFTTQRQLMRKNMPESALSGPYAQQQKVLLYVLPLVFAIGGIAFPVGVLLYWTTSNLWTMGQQFYVIRNNPAPGTPAFDAKAARDAKKAARHGTTASDPSAANGRPSPGASGNGEPAAKNPPRSQPKKVPRSKRRNPGPAKAPSTKPAPTNPAAKQPSPGAKPSGAQSSGAQSSGAQSVGAPLAKQPPGKRQSPKTRRPKNLPPAASPPLNQPTTRSQPATPNSSGASAAPKPPGPSPDAATPAPEPRT